MPPPETYKSEIGIQPTMCQVHTGAYVSPLATGKNRLYRLPPKKDYHVSIARSTYFYAYAQQMQVEKETKKIKGYKGKQRQESEKGKRNGDSFYGIPPQLKSPVLKPAHSRIS